jgi:hypothetical protein
LLIMNSNEVSHDFCKGGFWCGVARRPKADVLIEPRNRVCI